MYNRPKVEILRLNPEADRDIPLPRYMTPLSAGMDIYAAVTEDVTLPPGAVELIPTGFSMALPEGYEAQIRPRSGLAVNYGIGIINSPGTVDADYRGEVKIALINFGKSPFVIHRKDRIAQMVIHTVCRADIKIVRALSTTNRNFGGFGHTGMR
ncbi:MAG: dUTP diphosphatase [Desulfobacterales bacterium]